MTAILLTGAAGQGKTHTTILQVKRALARNLFGKVWVLLPTEQQIAVFRAQLMAEMGEAAHFGVEFFDFYDLYTRLLEMAGQPQRLVRDAARFRILRHVIAEVRDHLQHFDLIAETPGFVTLLAALIVEFKQAQITPEAFAAAAETPKDQDLSLIYGEYQAFLKRLNLIDRDGGGWLALAVLEERLSTLGVDLLIVDGYDQFNPVQARILGLLARKVPNTYLTLTYQPERADAAHRRFAQTRERLLTSSAPQTWSEVILPPVLPVSESEIPIPSASLAHLAEHLFEVQPPTLPNDGGLILTEAPDRRTEAQTVLRRVKRLLLAGVEPEQIAIVARSVEPYSPYFLESAANYGIPLATGSGGPLGENPAVAAILALVDLASGDFRRRVVMDVLENPYLACPDLTTKQIEQLDAISRAQVVVYGRQAWLDAVAASGASRAAETAEGDRQSVLLDHSTAQELAEALDNFFARVMPPQRARAGDHIAWLESLIGLDPASEREDESADTVSVPSFGLLERIRQSSVAAMRTRDLLAVKALKDAFAEILSAYDLVDPYEVVDWAMFRLDLQTAIDHASVNNVAGNRLGRVLLTSIYAVRGLAHNHVFLLGLSEGEFPARANENPLYSDAERRQLQGRGIALPTSVEEADEGSLFYEIAALARQSLTITRPYTDDRGGEWPASPYWRAARALLDTEVERLPIAGEIALADAADPAEAMLALAQAIGANGGAALNDEAAGVFNWVLGDPNLAPTWLNALHTRKMETQRLSPRYAHNAHSGYLSSPTLRALAAEMLGPQRLWSASQFNDYGLCPYRFFARRLLRLEALEEPEEGLDQLQFGSLMHEILELTYRQVEYEGLDIAPQNAARAQAILAAIMDERLPDAPQRYGFRATPLWAHEQDDLREQLAALVALDFSGNSPVSALFGNGEKDAPARPRHSVRQEVRFGWDGQRAVEIDGAAGPLRVRGAIDRVDESDGKLIVIDYKTGNTSIQTKEMIEGRNVQMMLYLAAARQIMSESEVVGGAFWHTATQKMSGNVAAQSEEVAEAQEALHQRILAGRDGIFVTSPSKRTQSGQCAHYCQYRQLCRMDHASGRKEIRPTTAS